LNCGRHAPTNVYLGTGTGKEDPVVDCTLIKSESHLMVHLSHRRAQEAHEVMYHTYPKVEKEMKKGESVKYRLVVDCTLY
jgi:hypothetical protein